MISTPKVISTKSVQLTCVPELSVHVIIISMQVTDSLSYSVHVLSFQFYSMCSL